MHHLNRRDLLGAMAFAGFATTTSEAQEATSASTSSASTATGASPAGPSAPVIGKDVTRTLARYLVSARFDDLPDAIRAEARRTLVNWAGCTIGGSRHETVDIAVAAMSPFSGPPQASLLGRKERLDILQAALINGIASHVFDFDDTHLKTVIHPGGPVASAILALAEHRAVHGRDFMNALVLGVETACRIGNAVYPDHYDRGWHITGSTGAFGAAAATGKLLGLTEQQMMWALGLAAAQPVGLREMFGSMTKSFHPGRAAQNGLTAALLAQRNFTSTDVGLEGKSGWANVLSTKRDYSEITDGLGQRYEIAFNTYKPFACGIVIHPAIDACIQLRNEHRLSADQIEQVELFVHPLVLELTGKKEPRTGLEAKFSVFFAAALALVRGSAGMRDFADEHVRNPELQALARRVVATIDPAVKEEQVRARVTLRDGRTLDKRIEHAVGSVERPMSDADLDAKFLDQAEGVIPRGRARQVIDACRRVDALPNAASVAILARAL